LRIFTFRVRDKLIKLVLVDGLFEILVDLAVSDISGTVLALFL